MVDLDVSAAGNPKRYLIKPAVLAKLLQPAGIKATDKVLIVGAATGYAAAVVSKMAAAVTATESDPALAVKADTILRQLGCGNVTVKTSGAADGDAAGAPYDVIVLNGATEIMPDGLYGQLREGGHLVGGFAASQPPRAVIVTRSHGDFGNRTLFDAAAPVLPGLERLPAFVF